MRGVWLQQRGLSRPSADCRLSRPSIDGFLLPLTKKVMLDAHSRFTVLRLKYGTSALK
jgi:hypothetical protein